jgi:hypothetical protein
VEINLSGRAVGLEDVRGRDPEKPRGLEVAALARAKHERDQDKAPSLAELPAPPAVVIELGRPEPSAGTYVRPEVRPPPEPAIETAASPDSSCPDAVLGEGASLHIEVHARVVDTAQSTIVLGDRASAQINVHADTIKGGGGTLLMDDDSSLHVNVHADTIEGSGGTLVLGKGASLDLDIHSSHMVTGGRLEVPDGVHLQIKVGDGDAAEKERGEKAAGGPAPGKTVVAGPHAGDAPSAAGPAPADEPSPEPEARRAITVDSDDADTHVWKQKPSRRSARVDTEIRDLRDLRWRLLHEVRDSIEQSRAKAALEAHQKAEEHRRTPAKPTRVVELPGAAGGLTADN